MTIFMALVRDDKGEIHIIESDYTTKENFIKKLRKEGYKVTDYKVKKRHVFHYIMMETDGQPHHWRENY